MLARVSQTLSGGAGMAVADPTDELPDLSGTAPPDTIDTPQERGEERLEYETLELREGIDCDGPDDDEGGANPRLSLEISNCISTWTCDDGVTYGFVCLGESCVCQIDGVWTSSVPRTTDPELDCGHSDSNTALEQVNARCRFWVD